jgi:hypothetical protein
MKTYVILNQDENSSNCETSAEIRQKQLNARIKEIDGILSKIHGKYFANVKGIEAIEKARAAMNADPEYRHLREEETKAWAELHRINAECDRAFLENELPSRLPKKSEKRLVEPESLIFTENGGIVNIRPIPHKTKKTDAKTALFGIAEYENEIGRDAMKGIFHDAENGVDVATDGWMLIAIPNGDNKKTWLEGRDGKEIESRFPDWKSAIFDNSIKIRINSLQALIDKFAGAARAARFVDNIIVIQFEVNGGKFFFNPEYLLKVAIAMQSTGSDSVVFEFNDSPKRPFIIRDASNKNKLVLIMPMHVDLGDGQKILITPVELEGETPQSVIAELEKDNALSQSNPVCDFFAKSKDEQDRKIGLLRNTKYIETGETRIDEGYEPDDAEYNQRKVYIPVYINEVVEKGELECYDDWAYKNRGNYFVKIFDTDGELRNVSFDATAELYDEIALGSDLASESVTVDGKTYRVSRRVTGKYSHPVRAGPGCRLETITGHRMCTNP